MKKTILAITVLALGLASCNTSLQVSKKRYSKGFYVGVTKKSNKVEKQELQKAEKEELNETAEAKLTAVENLSVSTEAFPEAAGEMMITRKLAEQLPTADNSVELTKEERKEVKALVKNARKELKKKETKRSSEVPVALLYILAILIPWLAVGLATDWDWTKVIIAFLLTLLCWIPGIIYAIIQVGKNT